MAWVAIGAPIVGLPGEIGATGNTGPAGETGAQGDPGVAGVAGVAGAASTVPGPAGETGAVGETGEAGARGTRVYAGNGLPSVVAPADWDPDGTDNADGDFYYDYAGGQWYILEA